MFFVTFLNYEREIDRFVEIVAEFLAEPYEMCRSIEMRVVNVSFADGIRSVY